MTRYHLFIINKITCDSEIGYYFFYVSFHGSISKVLQDKRLL